MLNVKINSSGKLKSPMGSTETLDGLTDLEVNNTPTVKKTRRGPNNLTIILIVILITWFLLFMGVTIYQIRSYRKEKLAKKFNKLVKESLDLKPGDTNVTNVILDKLKVVDNNWSDDSIEPRGIPVDVAGIPKSGDKLQEPFEGEVTVTDPNLDPGHVTTDPVVKDGVLPDEKRNTVTEKHDPIAKNEIVPGSKRENISPQGVRYVKVKLPRQDNHDVKRRKKRVFEKLETFITPPKLEDTGKKFSDLSFVKVNENCYRKDFYRTNIDGEGTNMKLVVKRAKITPRASLNSGDCVTTYHWIYDNSSTKTTNIFYLGPYYGHYSIRIFENLFKKEDDKGTFKKEDDKGTFKKEDDKGTFKKEDGKGTFKIGDGKGSFKIFGCDDTRDVSLIAPVGGKWEKIIGGKVIINEELFMFNDFKKFQEHLEKRAKEEFYTNKRLFDALKDGPTALDDFKEFLEAADCIFAI